jgi:hypothetical protein
VWRALLWNARSNDLSVGQSGYLSQPFAYQVNNPATGNRALLTEKGASP